jgi:AcrR family transcriptional regulator
MRADRARSGKLPRRQAVTREQLINSAEAGFLERGFHGATVEWLAAEAGFTTGAIYSSFGGKAGLFIEVLRRRNEKRRLEWKAAATSPDAEQAISGMLEQIFEDETFVAWTTAYLEFISFAARDPKIRESYTTHLEEMNDAFEAALEPLTRHSSIPPRDFAWLVLATSNGLAMLAALAAPDDQSHLMATLLSRLRDPLPARGRPRRDRRGQGGAG